MVRGAQATGHRWGDPALDPEVAAGRGARGGNPERPGARQSTGGMLSPRLATTWLDHVLDEWCAQEGKPRMKGRCVLLRVADDGVMGGEREDEAHRMLADLPKRFARFQLTMHPPKSRLVPFQPPRQEGDGAQGDGTFAHLRAVLAPPLSRLVQHL